MSTHEVANQVPPLAGYDALAGDVALLAAIEREGAGWALPELHELGRLAGDAAWLDRGARANAHPPALRTHDRYGHRIDEVEFDPSWHELLTTAVGAGLAGRPWADPRAGAHVARAAGYLLWDQVEAGHLCPVTMTYSSAAALGAQPGLAAGWAPALTYDPRSLPVADKAGALLGMAMTEKQGGSDLRANTTRAVPAADGYRLTGHKWFCSAPMSDGFLVLAQAPGGLSCFLLPRVLPDGSRNAIRLQRLKDKLGNRSNASAEIELDGATAWLVGEEGRGVPVIARMVNLTRLDCVLGSAGLIRRAVTEAIHHAGHRSAFGRRLVEQPLMTAVLADLALESEAATVLGMRLAAAVDRAERGDEQEALLRRLGTAIGKYWVCKRGPAATYEALECLGGNGYVEESGMPRLYREAPVNSIWEGSGNVNVLDVLRVFGREPATADALLAEIGTAAGGDSRLDAFAASLADDLHVLPAELAAGRAERGGRRLVERMALALQASLLVRHSPAEVADAFCAARLTPAGWAFGALPDEIPSSTAAALVRRASPHQDQDPHEIRRAQLP